MGPDALAGVAVSPLQTGADEWSSLFVTILALGFLMALAILITFNRWKRADLDPEHAVHILTQLDTFGGSRGSTVVVRSKEELDDEAVIRSVWDLFLGEPGGHPTTRSAIREVFREVRLEIRDRKPSVSRVPVRALQEAFLTALFGAIAILPIAVWRQSTQPDAPGLPTLPDVLGALSSGVDALHATLTAFPYTDTLFGLALTFGILGADTIWNAWVVPPIILTALAAAYWWLERKVETDRDLTGPSITGWALRLFVLGFLTWLTGTALAAVAGVLPIQPYTGLAVAYLITSAFAFVTLRPADAPESVTGFRYPVDEVSGPGPGWQNRVKRVTRRAADRAGRRMYDFATRVKWKQTAFVAVLALGLAHPALALFSAFVVASSVITYWTVDTLRGWRVAARVDGRDALALDVVHSLTLTAAALTFPLMVSYAIAAFWTRKALEVAAIVISAPPSTVYAVAILAVVLGLAVAVTFTERFADVRRGIRRALSVQAVRAAVFTRAFPFTLMLIAAVLTAAFGFGAVVVVAVALTIGFITRLGVMAYNFVSYRAHAYEGRQPTAARVVINGRKVTDADGESVYIADVNGHRTAHRRIEPLIQQVVRDARSLFREGKPETGSFARYYYEYGVRRGRVDMESVLDELLGDVRTRFIANVRDTDADAETILEKLHSEYPSNAVDRVVTQLKRRGRVTRREDRFQWLR